MALPTSLPGPTALHRSPVWWWRPGRRSALVASATALVLASLGPGVTAAETTLGTATYHVRAGDTLSAIAQATGTSVQDLSALNGLINPDQIRADQVLQVDGTVAGPLQTAAPAARAYVVHPGDTLLGIALANGTSVTQLVQLNALTDPNRIRVGQTLQLPATPTTTANSNLVAKVVADAQHAGGSQMQLEVAAHNLTTGAWVRYHAGDVAPSASVLKLGILAELERQISLGKRAWSPDLRAKVTAMMTVSDNQAADDLIALLGAPAINTSLQNWGLSSTQLLHPFVGEGGPSASAPTAQNHTSAADMAQLVELISTKQLISTAASTEMLGLMASNEDGSKLARLLPKDAQLAHKSGWYDGVANDAGLVTAASGNQWVVAVFTQGADNADAGNQAIAVISRDLYDAWK